METISQNISAFTKKEIINKEIEKEYEVIYVESNLLPKDEQKVVQEGEKGITEQTIILTYENEELVAENVLNELEISKPVEKIIEVGTSEFLFKNKVHVGDVMYTTEEIEIYDLEKNLENIINDYELNDQIYYLNITSIKDEKD